MKGPSTRQKLAPLLAKLRGLRDPALDMVAGKGGPVEAVLQRLFPDYESQRQSLYSAQTPEEWAEVAQGFAGAGPTRLEKALLKGEVGIRTAERAGVNAPSLRGLPEDVRAHGLARTVHGQHGAIVGDLKKYLREELQHSREDLRTVRYQGRRMPMDELRARTDIAIAENTLRNPQANAHATETQSGASTIPRSVEAMHHLRQFHPEDFDAARWDSPPVFVNRDAFPPSHMRSTLEHEFGEREALTGKRPAAKFATHAGPSALLREFYTAARRPHVVQSLLERLRNDPEEGRFVAAFKQAGGSPARPVPPTGKQANAVAKVLATKLRKGGYDTSLPPTWIEMSHDIEETAQMIGGHVKPVDRNDPFEMLKAILRE